MRTTSRLPVLVLGLVPVVALTACGQVEGEELAGEAVRAEVRPGEATALPAVAAAADGIGLRILASAADGNVVTSPAGAQVALAMVGEGAADEAAEQLDALLGAAGQDRTDAVNALLADLEPLDGDPALAAKKKLPEKTLVHLANRVTVDDQAQLVPGYLDRLSAGYGAGVTATDLGSEDGKEVLDRWVREESGGLVDESAIQPDPDLRLVWQNAMVVAAAWEQPFDATVTRDVDFTLGDGQVVRVDTMHQTTHRCVVEVDGWSAVRLPYRGGELFADLLLPPEGTDPGTLTPEQLAGMTDDLDCAEPEAVEVELGLPRADLTTSVDLLPFLQETAPDLLTPGGLPGISTEEPLFVSQASQQGVLKVDEEGTVAAVVTEIGAAAGAAPPPDPLVLTFDHPYLVRLATTSTDWPLVMARVADPRG